MRSTDLFTFYIYKTLTRNRSRYDILFGAKSVSWVFKREYMLFEGGSSLWGCDERRLKLLP